MPYASQLSIHRSLLLMLYACSKLWICFIVIRKYSCFIVHKKYFSLQIRSRDLTTNILRFNALGGLRSHEFWTLMYEMVCNIINATELTQNKWTCSRQECRLLVFSTNTNYPYRDTPAISLQTQHNSIVIYHVFALLKYIQSLFH